LRAATRDALFFDALQPYDDADDALFCLCRMRQFILIITRHRDLHYCCYDALPVYAATRVVDMSAALFDFSASSFFADAALPPLEQRYDVFCCTR